MKTSLTGKYAHLGTSVLHFGRDDGFNECGLAVTMSSCSFPVGALQIDHSSTAQLLYATNHPLLPELVPYESQAMRNSLQRYELIGHTLEGKGQVSEDDLKQLLLGKFPAGLNCPYYEDFFGTTKSMIMNPAKGTMELCWGGRSANGWRSYDIHEPLGETVLDIELYAEKAHPEFFEFVPIPAN